MAHLGGLDSNAALLHLDGVLSDAAVNALCQVLSTAGHPGEGAIGVGRTCAAAHGWRLGSAVVLLLEKCAKALMQG